MSQTFYAHLQPRHQGGADTGQSLQVAGFQSCQQSKNKHMKTPRAGRGRGRGSGRGRGKRERRRGRGREGGGDHTEWHIGHITFWFSCISEHVKKGQFPGFSKNSELKIQVEHGELNSDELKEKQPFAQINTMSELWQTALQHFPGASKKSV